MLSQFSLLRLKGCVLWVILVCEKVVFLAELCCEVVKDSHFFLSYICEHTILGKIRSFGYVFSSERRVNILAF